MSVILGKFPIMMTKQSVRGGWSGAATGVRRSRVPLVIYILKYFIRFFIFFQKKYFCKNIISVKLAQIL
jgi:hypothetical protein